MKSGHYRMARGWMENPVFKREPFTEREAWLWLIEKAAFRPYKKNIGGTIVPLERGQLTASLRFMAEAWQWKKDRVRRFLKRLADDSMLSSACSKNATAQMLITVCNYKRYQAEPDDGATATRQQRDSNATNKKEIKEIKKDILDDSFERFWKAYPSRGKSSNPKKPAKAKFLTKVQGGADPESIILAAARYAEIESEKGTEPQFIAQAVTWLNQERWEQYRDDQMEDEGSRASPSEDWVSEMEAARARGPEAYQAWIEAQRGGAPV